MLASTKLSFLLCALCFHMALSYSHLQTMVDDRVLPNSEFTTVEWQCGDLLCPPGTFRCYVSLRNVNENPSQAVRENICYDANNHELKKLKKYEIITPGTRVFEDSNSYQTESAQGNHMAFAYANNGGNNGFAMGNIPPMNFPDPAQLHNDIMANIEKQGKAINDAIQKQKMDIENTINSFKNRLLNF